MTTKPTIQLLVVLAAATGCGTSAGSDASASLGVSLEARCASSCRRHSETCDATQREAYRLSCISQCQQDVRSVPEVCRGYYPAVFDCAEQNPTCGVSSQSPCEAAACPLNACVAAEQRRQGLSPSFSGTCDAGP